MTALRPVQSPLLSALPSVRHAFFTREGGVSQGLYAGLNVGRGSRDDPPAVEENRARAAAWFGLAPDALLTAHQVHSATALEAGAFVGGARPEGDAVVARAPGVICGALAADCAPVLLADAEARIVAAAHAGWKGRARRDRRGRRRGHGARGGLAGPHRRRRRPLHRADQLRGGRGLPRRLRRPGAGGLRLLRRRAGRTGSGASTCPASCWTVWRAPASNGRRASASTPAPTRRASSPTAAPISEAKRTTAAFCRPSRWTDARTRRLAPWEAAP